MEFDGSQQVLERLAGGAAFHQIAQRLEFRLAQGAVKFEVEIDPFLAQDMGEEEFGIEPRALDAVFLEVAGGGGNDFLHGFQNGGTGD